MKQRKEVRIAVRITSELRDRIDSAVDSTGIPEPVVVTKCLEAYCDYVEQQGEISFPLILKPRSKESETPRHVAVSNGNEKPGKSPVKAKRAHLRDIREASIPLFGTIPAGVPSECRQEAEEFIPRPKGKNYSKEVFALRVQGESMNAAKGKLGHIRPGDRVIMEPFTSADEAAGKIVAALIDGATTLKRLVCPKGKECYLRAESTDPQFSDCITPLNSLTVQGVVVDKL